MEQHFEAAQALHNRAIAAHQRSDLAEALGLFDIVAERFQALNAFRAADLVVDHARVMLTAGLVGEAREMIRQALTTELQPVRRAEILLTAAQAALAEGDLGTAAVDSGLAGRLFAAQQRPLWAHRAKLSCCRRVTSPTIRILETSRSHQPTRRQQTANSATSAALAPG
jgi:hypothetical protein